jgi:hypothetical protein
MNLLPRVMPRSEEQKLADAERALIRRQANMGGKLFGSIPKGHQRQFFCLDERTWVWHEEWQENGIRKIVTTRYKIRRTGIIKSQNDQAYTLIAPRESLNLYKAITLYYQNMYDEYERTLQFA